jgi:hypothetical protein
MALGMSAYLANAVLDAIGNNTAMPAIANVYLQLHVGDPGAAGLSAPAGETTRREVTFQGAGYDLDGEMPSDADTGWYLVSTTETYTHYSAWDAVSGGNFLWSDTIAAGPATINENFVVPAGQTRLTIAIAS